MTFAERVFPEEIKNYEGKKVLIVGKVNNV